MNSVQARLLSAVLLSLVCSTDAGAQSTAQKPTRQSDTQANEVAQALVKANRGWGENINSSGAVLKLVEIGRVNGRIAYRLRTQGLAGDHIYSLIQWPVTQGQPSVALQGVTISKSGVAVCAGKPGTCGDPAKPDDPINLQTAPVRGEPLRFALVAQDDPELRAAVKIVPIPNSSVDQGCRVDAVLLTPHAELVSVEANGFPPNTEITIMQNSAGEVHTELQKSDETGRLTWAVMPAKAGLKNGSITIQAKAPGCDPQLSVPWGIP